MFPLARSARRHESSFRSHAKLDSAQTKAEIERRLGGDALPDRERSGIVVAGRGRRRLDNDRQFAGRPTR